LGQRQRSPNIGKAKIISRENSTEFKEGLEAYQWEKTVKELGLKTFPKIGVELVKVEPEKIEFIDMTLKKLCYSHGKHST
jgi:hypothetical protein